MKTSKVLRCFLSIILIGGIGLLSIPSFAYTVNGIELVPVQLTNEQFLAMFNNGDFTVSMSFQPSINMSMNVYDMVNQSKTVFSMLSSGVYTPFQFTHAEIQTEGNNPLLLIYSDYSYSQRAENGNLNINLFVKLPFQYYCNDSTFYIRVPYSGLSNDSYPVGHLIFRDSDNNELYDYANSSQRFVGFWNGIGSYRQWYNHFLWVPEGYTMTSSTSTEGIRTCYSNYTFSDVDTTVLSDSMVFSWTNSTVRASGSGTGYDNFFCAPGVIVLDFRTTVYVMPEIVDTVEEYLDIIVGPTTPTQQARINELKDKFDDTLDDLDGAKENIHKDMPDLPSVSDLPEEAIDGMEDASEYVINPFLSIGIVSTLLGVTFIFTVIKILLYGSGPY